MKQLEHMKETLTNCVQSQLGNLSQVNAQELGEAVDMIKDLSEAIYYCKIIEAMDEEGKEGKEKHFYYPMFNDPSMYNQNRYFMEYEQGGGGNRGGGNRNYMEYAQGGGQGGGGSQGGGGGRNYSEYARDMDRGQGKMYYEYARGVDGSRQSPGESRNYPVEIRDYREGRSPMTRRNYMESKEMHKGTPHQMQELEKYMHELSDDITEMIQGASPEEKQMMQKKLSVLATKIV